MPTIFNIQENVFGGPVKNGDLIAVCNVVAHLRKNIPDLQFHMLPGSVSTVDYIQKFYEFLLDQTDYLSRTLGAQNVPWRKVNLWDFRDTIGDNVVINNNLMQEKKIVIFPTFDAPYNQYRNWSQDAFNELLKEYDHSKFEGYRKVICHKTPLNIKGWEDSTDFMQNINHIMTSEIFVGGDTGTSHFAWALDNGPSDLIYYNSGRGLVHCLPFYLLEGKGKYKKYWLNFEGTTW